VIAVFELIWGLAAIYARRPPRSGPRILHPALVRTHRLRCFMWAATLASGLTLLLAHPAVAAAGFNIFDPIVNTAQGESVGWFNTIVGLVRPTFLLLGTIEICWAAAVWAFERDSLNSLAVEIIKKIMFIGFFYALLQFAPDWIPSITNSFQTAGEAAAGTPALSTDTIVAMGLNVIGTIWTNTLSVIAPVITLDPEEILGNANPLAYAGLVYASAVFVLTIVATVIIAIAYVVVAAQYFTLKIETYVLFAAGAIFLGLGSSSWTKEYVTKYLNYAINVGVRLLVLILILSLTLNAVNNMVGGFSLGFGIVTFNVKPLLSIMAAAVLQAILGMKAPEMAGALLGGGGGLTAGSVTGSLLSTVSNLRMASGLATGGTAGAAPSAAAGKMGSLNNALSAGRGMGQQPDRSGAGAALGGLAAGAGIRQAASMPPGNPGTAIRAAANAGSGGGVGGLSQTSGLQGTPAISAAARGDSNSLGSLMSAAERTDTQAASAPTNRSNPSAQVELAAQTRPTDPGSPQSGNPLPDSSGTPLSSSLRRATTALSSPPAATPGGGV
jgi:type IV secretion system protein TrbL